MKEEETLKEECDDCGTEAIVRCNECDWKFCYKCSKWHDCIFGRDYTFNELKTLQKKLEEITMPPMEDYEWSMIKGHYIISKGK